MIIKCLSNEIEFDLEKFNLNCWKKDNSEPMYIFTKQFDNEKDLIDNWKGINNSIAVEFQSQLENIVSIWNLYLIFFIKDSVSIEHKYEIEQDKYSTRKIVKDGFSEDEKKYIEDKLFNLEISNTSTQNDKSLEDVLLEKYPKYKELLKDNSNEN